MNTSRFALRSLISAIAVGGALALAPTAFAAGPGMGPGAGMADGAGPGAQTLRTRMQAHQQERMAAHHQRDLQELKTQLKLDPSQEGAWKTFSDSMQAPAQRPAHPDRAAMEKMSTPERMDAMKQMHAQREAQMNQRSEAVKTFYNSLNADQKKIFDQKTARAMHGEHHGKGGHDGEGHGPHAMF